MPLKVMTAIQGYSLGGGSGPTVSGVMAPIRSAVDGAPAGNIQFFRLTARAESTTPAFCKFSCSQPSGDDNTDLLNYYNYVIGHTWSFTVEDEGTYSQTDALDPDTFEATGATVSEDTFPDPGFNGGLAPTWNNQFGYFWPTPNDPNFISTSGADWDKSSTRAGIIAALNTVNWTALWADGTSSPNDFAYDRAQISANNSGRLPFGPSGNTGAIVAGNVPLGPSLALNGTVGILANAVSASELLGVSLTRTQIQIRNFIGPNIPYFIYEFTDIADSISVLGNPGSTVRDNTAISLINNRTVFRKLSEGVWDHDLQIIQLPDAAMDGPAVISTTFGDKVRNGTSIGMVVGMTFEDFMFDIFGATWADNLFT